jgi:hypothetical protein
MANINLLLYGVDLFGSHLTRVQVKCLSLRTITANISTMTYLAWTAVASAGSREWNAIAMNSDGKFQSAVVWGGSIWTSSNYGAGGLFKLTK